MSVSFSNKGRESEQGREWQFGQGVGGLSAQGSRRAAAGARAMMLKNNNTRQRNTSQSHDQKAASRRIFMEWVSREVGAVA